MRNWLIKSSFVSAALAAGLLLPSVLNAQLPSSVDNSQLPWFPPIRTQGDVGSCACFSSTYYTMTYMTARARGWDVRNNSDNTNKFSPKFTYNMINGGENGGTWHDTAMQMMIDHGCPTWEEWPYQTSATPATNYLAWPTSGLIWRSAINYRMSSRGQVTGLDTDAGLNNLKTMLNNGYILNFATYINSWQTKTVLDDPSTSEDNAFVGQTIGYNVNGTDGGHSMTIVGYDDSIWVDIDSDWIVDANEKGALKIANSWGTGRDNAGFIWCAYELPRNGGFWTNNASFIEARSSYTPTFVGEITCSHLKRNQMHLFPGTGGTGDSEPTSILSNTALSGDGGEYAFDGTTTSCSATFCLDFSDIAAEGVNKRYFMRSRDTTSDADGLGISAFKMIAVADSGAETVCSNMPQTANGSYVNPYVEYNLGSMRPLVSSPSAATNLYAGQNLSIAWAVNTAGANVEIRLYKAGEIAETISSSTPNDGSFSWTVSANLATGSDYKVRVLDKGTPELFDDSADFAIDNTVSKFAFSNIASTQVRNSSFPVTVTAKNVADNTVANFTGTANFAGQIGNFAEIGTGSTSFNYLFYTYYHDARTSTIYLASELGGAGTINRILYNVSGVPGRTMNNFKIRMKHTTASKFSASTFDNSGWTLVYSGNRTISSTGWEAFALTTPFAYNGTSNLMVDVSFNNSDYADTGTVASTGVSGERSICNYSDSEMGDPLTWTVSESPIKTIPNIKVDMNYVGAVSITPLTSGNFVAGVWTGEIAVTENANGMSIKASNATGAGTSNVFNCTDTNALVYSAATFHESAVNSGAIDNGTPISITINGETFAGSNGENFVASGKILVSNLPSGLTAMITRISSIEVQASLNGAASVHANADDIANLTFAFQNSAFTGGNAAAILNSTRDNLAINFNNPTVVLATTDSLASEPGKPQGNGVFTVSRDSTTGGALTVNYTVSGASTAVSGEDYTALAGSVQIADGADSATISVSPIDDGVTETDETVIVVLSADAGYNLGTQTQGTVTIVDDESTNVSLTASDPTASEPGRPNGNGVFTVSRDSTSGGAMTVNYTVSGASTATSGDDYTALTGSVQIADGAYDATITVAPIDDGITETDETVVVELSPDAAYNLGPQTQGTVTILDDEPTTVSLTTTDTTAAEPGRTEGNANFRVSRLAGASTTEALDVNLTFTGTSANGADFTQIPNPVSIPAGQTFLDIPVAITNDSVAELDETVSLTLAPGTGYNIDGANNSGTVTIYDDETPTISVAVTDSTCSEASSNDGVFTFTRKGDRRSALTVNYSLAGTAVNGTDYTSMTGTFNLNADSVTATVSIDPTDDSICEGDETAIAAVAQGAGYVVGAPSEATITISDNDKPTISIAASDATASEPGANAGTFTFTRVNDTKKDAVTVLYAVTGTASTAADYGRLPGFAVIPQGSDTATVVVSVRDDAIPETIETVIASISANSAYSIASSPNNSATISINDNDDVLVSVSSTDNSCAEPGISNPAGTFTFTRTGGVGGDLTVNYIVRETSTAASGADYAALSGSIVIPDGEAIATVTVTPLDDLNPEPDETVIIGITGGAGYQIGYPNSATVSIYDDEPPTLFMSVPDADCAEASSPGNGTFRINRLGNKTNALTVNITLDGTAKATDYSNVASAQTVNANAASKDITITPTNDADAEGSESVTITLASGAGYEIGAPDSETIYIKDDETVDVSVSANDPIALEGSAVNTGYFRITRSLSSSSPLTVNYSISGSAGNGSDYAALSGSATIPAEQTAVNVYVDASAHNDAVVEGAETVLITLLYNGANYDIGTASATVTLQDDDTPTITLAASDNSATEPADTGTFTFTSSFAPSSDLIVSYSIGGTALAGMDYIALPGTVTLPAGQTTANVMITPIDDLFKESNETVQLTLAQNGAYNCGTITAQAVSLYDNDTPTLTVVATDPSAVENGVQTGIFTVYADKPFSTNTTVNIAVSGTATSGTDFTSLGTSFSFPSGQFSSNRTVTPVADGTAESPETVILDIAANGTNYNIGSPSGATVTISDDSTSYTVTFQTDGTPGASLTGETSQTVPEGADCSPVSAIVPLSWHFLNWTKSGVEFSTDTTVSPTNVMENMSLTVHFAKNSPEDFDGDSKSDVICESPVENGFIYFMNANAVSSFSNIYDKADKNWEPAKFADFNGDGKTDMLWEHEISGQVLVYLMNGASILSVRSIYKGGEWKVEDCADFNGDGKDDILWTHPQSGSSALYLMNGVNVSSVNTLHCGIGWLVRKVADFNGDAKADILWEINGVQGHLCLMNGATVSSEAMIYSKSPAWNLKLFGDFNGDSKTDILWESADGKAGYVYLMNGTAVLPASGYSYVKSDLNWKIVNCADYDGDGKYDILWEHDSDVCGMIHLMDGTAVSGSNIVYTLKDPNPATKWNVVKTLDFNGDSKSDLLWENSGTQKTLVYLMNGLAISSSGTVYSNGAGWRLIGD